MWFQRLSGSELTRQEGGEFQGAGHPGTRGDRAGSGGLSCTSCWPRDFNAKSSRRHCGISD